jgi:hypothetical protein
METIVNTKFGTVKIKFIYDNCWEAEAFELRNTQDEFIGMIRGVDGEEHDEMSEEFITVTDDGEELFKIKALTKLVEDYIENNQFAYNVMTGNVGSTLTPSMKVNVLYVSDIDMLVTSKVLLVLNSKCDKEIAIKAIVDAIKMHEGYDNDTTIDDDDPYDCRYTDDELRSKAVRLLEYGEEFYADRTYDSTFYLKKNLPIVG